MIKKFILVSIFFATLYADNSNEKFINCERIQLAELTDIVSCNKVDYLLEYEQNDSYKRGEVQKVTAITHKDIRVIKAPEKTREKK